MADYKGVNYTKSEDPIADNIIGAGLLDVGEKILTDVYEASAIAQNKTIALFKDLPVGAIIMGGSVYFDALGSNSAIIVGDSNDDDRYLTNTATTSAGVAHFNAVNGNQYTIGTNNGDNTILLKANNTGALTGTIKAVVRYTMGK